MAVPAIAHLDPNPLTEGSSFRVFGQRFESGCSIEYIPNYEGWSELLGSTVPTWVNAGFLTTINYPDSVEAPTGWWTRVRNPGGETSNVMQLTWYAEPEPCPDCGPPAECPPYPADISCCGDEFAEYADGVQERSVMLAWDTLRVLSGGRVGNCPVVMRPCFNPPCNYCVTTWLEPMIVDGQWVNNVCGSPKCTCQPLCEIVFPGSIAAVLEVAAGGESLAPANFRVDNGNRLVRTDGECWPSCNDDVSITYIPGIDPGAAGQWAAGVLACEFARACSGGKCRLPSGVTTIARQGLSMNLTTGMFPDGLTGIREVDAYITSINPNHLKLPPMVWSPDVPWAKHRYQTWSA